MRILAITNDFPPTLGGIENYLFSLLSRWKPDDVVVLTRSVPGAEAVDASLSFEVVRLRTKTLLPTPKASKTAKTLIASRGIDALYFASPMPLPLLGPSLGLPYAVAIHGGEFVLASSLPVLKSLLRYGTGRASAFVCESTFALERVRAFFGGSTPATFVPGGMDPSRFAVEIEPAFHSPSGGPVILSVCRLIARKGPATLIRSLPRILQSHPDAHLLIVGGGPAAPSLMKLARREEVMSSVTFAGPKPWGEIPSYYASATIFALPTRERFGGLESEGLPLVFVEAAAAGLPSIAGRAGGVEDAVVSGETGVIVDGSDAKQTADAIIGLLDDPARAQEMGRIARERALREFSWDVIFERFRAALEAMSI